MKQELAQTIARTQMEHESITKKLCFLFSLSEWRKNKLWYFKLAKELEIIMSEEYLHWVGFH